MEKITNQIHKIVHFYGNFDNWLPQILLGHSFSFYLFFFFCNKNRDVFALLQKIMLKIISVVTFFRL